VPQYFQQLGADVVVYRNDAVTIEELEALDPVRIVVSPGPGTPAEAGVSMDVIRHFAGKIPILGVCLGHQAMVEVFGGIVEGAGEIMHGKQSKMHHDGRGVFHGLPSPILACRYHSLAARPSSIPDCLEVTCFSVRGEAAAPPSSARTDPASMTDAGSVKEEKATRAEGDVIQGVRHREFCIEGVQFHPESIATQGGMSMFRNFLLQTKGKR
jgi:anthranilate synthase component II